MKKPKISLNGESIKQMFISHGEKIGLGVALLVTAVLVVFAIKKESLSPDLGKDRLEALVNQAEGVIRNGSGTVEQPVPEKIETSALVPIKEDAAKDIKLAASHRARWSPLTKDERPKRTAPGIVAVRSLQGFADRGAIAMKGAGAAAGPAAPAPPAAPDKSKGPGGLLGGQTAPPVERPAAGGPAANILAQGRRFIMLTGIVPTAEQQAEYDVKFENAIHPGPNDDTVEPKLDRFHPRYYLYNVKRREVLKDGKFGPETPLDIREIWTDKLKGWSSTGGGGAEPAKDRDYLDERLTFPLPPLLTKRWDERVSHPDIPALKTATPTDGQDQPSDDPLAAGNPDPQANNPRKLAGGAGAPAEAKQVDFKLFRCWDYTVDPDKSYQYSVQLIAYNPNYKLPEKLLEDAKLATDEKLTSPWSEWTPTIHTPRDHQIFAKSVEFNRDSREPVAHVVCWTWDHKNAVEVEKEYTMVRGDVSSFTENKFSVPAPVGGTLTLDTFRFQPNAMLLDFRGGHQTLKDKELDKKLPCELCFYDITTQQIMIRSELTDAAILADIAPKNTRPGRGIGGLGGGDSGLMEETPPIATKGGTEKPGNALLGPPSGTPEKATSPKGSPKGK